MAKEELGALPIRRARRWSDTQGAWGWADPSELAGGPWGEPPPEQPRISQRSRRSPVVARSGPTSTPSPPGTPGSFLI